MAIKVLLRGGGDLASGAAIRMLRVGMQILICELNTPYAVRRSVSFAEAIYSGKIQVEDITSIYVKNWAEACELIQHGNIPLLIDPNLDCLADFQPDVLVDGRMLKTEVYYHLSQSPMVIGLGPGFICGKNCHAAIETRRGPNLGRVVWIGSPEADTGTPEQVENFTEERIVRAPVDGTFQTETKIGDQVFRGQLLGTVDQQQIRAQIDGIVRGILRTGLPVTRGMKLGDIDPRLDESLTHKVSDKALAIGGGVLEAILAWPENRLKLAGD